MYADQHKLFVDRALPELANKVEGYNRGVSSIGGCGDGNASGDEDIGEDVRIARCPC